jgi:glycerophosphoryl diester phosphodiesterase
MNDAPENTKAAFDAALAHAVDGLELDVQLTRDGVAVVFHDPTLAGINGDRKSISDFDYSDLEALDFGRWFSPEFGGEKILTLDEVLAQYSQRTRLLIEIKSFDRDRQRGLVDTLTKTVLESLDRLVPNEYAINMFILSFDAAVLRRASKIVPGHQYVRNVDFPQSKLDRQGHLYACSGPIRNVTREWVAALHAHDRRAMTWSCNTPEQVEKALTTGVDAIMTDRPEWLTGYRRARGNA